MDKQQKLMALNKITSMKREINTDKEIEKALTEIRQNQADLEDALIELAALIVEGD